MRWILLALILMPHFVLGATISGTVYDLELNEVPNSVITIDTEPEQRIVAKEGVYSVEVPEGEYTLETTATINNEKWVASETVKVSLGGSYTIDLILIPDFNLDDLNLESEDYSLVVEDETNDDYLWVILLGIITLIVAGAIFLITKKDSKIEEDEFVSQVISVLKKHGGRATQKQLRKELPFSEAKVSLVISQLESENKIKKIKKGRGNILILK